MRRLCFGITGLLLLAGCSISDPEVQNIREGDRLPDFVVEMQDGTSLSGSELREVPSLILFFNTTCPDCRKTIPVVQKAYENFGKTVRFVAISRAQQSDEVKSWWSSNGISIPYSAQPDRKVYELFASSRIPRIYISGSDGIVEACFADNPCPDYDLLAGALEKVTSR